MEVTNIGPTIRRPVIPVSDLDATKAVYASLRGAPRRRFRGRSQPGRPAGGPVAVADVAFSSALDGGPHPAALPSDAFHRRYTGISSSVYSVATASTIEHA